MGNYGFKIKNTSYYYTTQNNIKSIQNGKLRYEVFCCTKQEKYVIIFVDIELTCAVFFGMLYLLNL